MSRCHVRVWLVLELVGLASGCEPAPGPQDASVLDIGPRADAFPDCEPGTITPCPCAEGGVSTQQCGPDGTYRACDCRPDASAGCEDGAMEACSCEDAGRGSRGCYEGVWSVCVCPRMFPPPCVWHRELCNDLDDDCDGMVDERVALCPFDDDPSATLPIAGGVYVGLTTDPVWLGSGSGMVFHAVVGTMPDVSARATSAAFLRTSDRHAFYVTRDEVTGMDRLYDAASPSLAIPTPFPLAAGSALDIAFDGDVLLFASNGLYRGNAFLAPDVTRVFVSPGGHVVVFRRRTVAMLDAAGRQESAIDVSGFPYVTEPLAVSFSGEHAFVLYRTGYVIRLDLEDGRARPVRRAPPDENSILALSDGRVLVADGASDGIAITDVRAIAMDGTSEVLWRTTERLGGPVRAGDVRP